MKELSEIRKEINDIDLHMAQLFEKRMHAVEQVYEYKKQFSLPIVDKERENAVVARGSTYISDPVIREYYVNVLENIIATSVSYQQRMQNNMKVAYSGTEGAFAHIAANRCFGSANLMPYANFEQAYNSVVNGECDSAVLPIENSYAGEVGQVIDLIFSGSLYINGVVDVAITHNLLGIKGAKADDITEVVSHPQALGQCAEYISAKGYSQKTYVNTALAAKYVSELGDKHVACIASAETADIFGLEMLDHDINTSRSNTTRFGIFSRAEHCTEGSTDSRAIMIFTVSNVSGALAKCINVIGAYGFNMINLRSRPTKDKLWQYYFFVEIEGNLKSPEGNEMLSALSAVCQSVRVVGNYRSINA